MTVKAVLTDDSALKKAALTKASLTRVLVVSKTKNSASVLTGILNAVNIKNITVLHSAGDTLGLLSHEEFDIVIIDSPLTDESGEKLARNIALRDFPQVIYAVEAARFADASSSCEAEGIFTISKPVNADIFWSAISLAKSAGNRIRKIKEENAKLKQKIDDIRIIDRAKCLLISYINLSEQEAHKFIEKQAMDLRSSKRSIAEEIIKTYAS